MTQLQQPGSNSISTANAFGQTNTELFGILPSEHTHTVVDVVMSKCMVICFN